MTGTTCACAGCPNDNILPANTTAMNALNWMGQPLMFILKNLRQKINTTSQIFGENPRCGAGVAGRDGKKDGRIV
jgi:hypothetical protein